MQLIVTIDTEEEFDWNAPFSRQGYATDNINIYHQKLSEFYDKQGVVPVIVASYPIFHNHKTASLLKSLHDNHNAIVGVHLHPWVTPPEIEDLTPKNSYVGNLPYDTEYQKIKTMTDIYHDVIGHAPTIYKAGRYGIGKNTDKILSDMGYIYDLSYHAGKNFSYDGGPDMRHIRHDIFTSDAGIIHIPVTGTFIGQSKNNKILQNLVLKEYLYGLPIRGLLSKLNLCNFITLTPENTPLEYMKKMTLTAMEQGIDVFQMTFHSSIFQTGYIPYIQTADDVENMKKTIQDYIFFFKELGGKTGDFRENFVL